MTQITELINSIVKLADKWLSGTKGRRTRAALYAARSAMKRAEKLHPTLKDDKHYAKYREAYEKNVTLN